VPRAATLASGGRGHVGSVIQVPDRGLARRRSSLIHFPRARGGEDKRWRRSLSLFNILRFVFFPRFLFVEGLR
jgi:hypothetical protein